MLPSQSAQADQKVLVDWLTQISLNVKIDANLESSTVLREPATHAMAPR
jgi:hypothetical protein